MCAMKAKSQQNNRGKKVGKAGSDEIRKKAGDPARSASTFSKKDEKFHQQSWFLAVASDFPEADRPPHNYQADYRAGLGGGRELRIGRKTHHLSDKMVTQWLEKSPPPAQASHPQQMQKYRECWWSLVLHVACEWTGEDFLWVSRKKTRKTGGNLCAEASTWNHVHRGNLCRWKRKAREGSVLRHFLPGKSPVTLMLQSHGLQTEHLKEFFHLFSRVKRTE